MAISSYSTVTDKFATLNKMPDENLNAKNRTQKYSGKIDLYLDDVDKYSVTHKDITNILAGDSQSFLKRSLWEFILDLFPMYHIKEAKQAIIDFVTETGDKVDIFNRIKSLADQDQQWRFNTTTEFTVDENKDIIVSRVFNININAQDHHNDAEKNTMRSLFSEELSLDIYKHDIHFDQKAFQSGMLKMQFPNDNEKLSVYLKNKIPFENITIDLSALEKEALASLKYCNFKKVTFTGAISYENLNGSVFGNCFFEDCIFENLSLVSSRYRVKPNNEIPIYGVFKECFLYRCEIKNFNIDTSKIYSVNQDPNVGKLVGAYLFMQSFVNECTLQDGVCKNASVIASSLLCCKIAKLNGAEMDFIGTSFYHQYRHEYIYDNHFYHCDFSASDMTYKRNGIRKDLLDFDPRDYFKKDGGKLNLDKRISNLIYNNIFSNMSEHHYINNKDVGGDIDKYLKLSNCNLLKTCLGESINGIKLYDCAIDPSTTWLSYNLASNTQISIPVYMDMKGAIDKNDISDFMKNLMEINSWVEEFNTYGKDVESHYQKELLYLQSLLVKLGRFNLDDEGKKYQLNGEAIRYITLNVLHNIEKDIANEIDLDKVNFMHELYTGFFWYRPYDERNFLKINPSGISNSKILHFHFNFNDLRNIYEEYNKNQKDDNIDSFNNMQKIFLALNKFKERTEKNYRDYRKVSTYVDDKVDLFSGIERYLLGVIEKNNSYNEENYGNKKDKYAKLIYERNGLVDTKDQLIKENFELNNKDNKDKKDVDRINEIKGIIKIIDGKIPNISEEILHLKNETERLEKEYEQENTLNDVVQNISRWLKENENMVKAIKKIDTNNMANK
ncbi:type III effector protein [Escherichia coli]|uniref:type III effector protein n=1 Tax=Escherichia coli TaxID=562 RepID=UPI001C9B6B43|nr:type III effector protein [Escherichia coli]MBY7177097.1 type III effector protein [Escherichia coli]MBY7252526.1 type III effector protein [Escherichia coli]MBY7267686.1 type III effector protein [Escherichia coli]MBY7372531.1 type III effector protein [Escherichia coli]MBY7394213.1 type III effector protein [Escherichia coli]